jgi:hypothetical protein
MEIIPMEEGIHDIFHKNERKFYILTGTLQILENVVVETFLLKECYNF